MNNSEITIDNSKESVDLYESLKQDILSNENLSEADRLVYYKLHLRVTSPDDYIFQRLLRRLLNEKTFNPRYTLSDDERRLLFTILEKKRTARGLDRHEYRYYCFLAGNIIFQLMRNALQFPRSWKWISQTLNRNLVLAITV